MPPELLPALAQFGAAGLIGWMWLTERRAAADREAQLRQAHEALMTERPRLDALLRALDANTRAITALELGQRSLLAAVQRDRREDHAPRSAAQTRRDTPTAPDRPADTRHKLRP
ncbi:MAG: hypothetical protein KF699_04810 [Phycisphaeraceae bacterium]|nr:hypothetical protein [Phycisphaeraceae bacterium]MBX3405371.1 hypothetical protein [Phycisphaeraceae bacterium]